MIKVYGRLCELLDDLHSPFLLAIRLYWGYQFFITGKGKLLHLDRVTGFFADLHIPFPHANAMLVGTTECVGGLMVLVGFLSRLASIPLTVVVSMAYVTVFRADLIAVFSNPDAFLKDDPFLFLLAVVIVLVFGPGKFSVDHLLKKQFYKEAPCHE